MNVNTRVLGYDEVGEDQSNLKQRLERTGHYWAFELRVVNYAKAVIDIFSFVPLRDVARLTEAMDYFIFSNYPGVVYYRQEVRRLCEAILIQKGFSVYS